MNSNTSSIFMQQSLDFQFLSVCHYITIFGIYFYNNDLITLDEKSQSVPVLNTLFEYLNKSKNESEAKFQLLKKVLKGSDLYGGGENESLGMKYVDETYQYIINKALFSHYGNINGYLAKIINTVDDVNYLVFKEKVFQHLSENYTSREYCSNDIPLGNYDSKKKLGNYDSKNKLGNYDSKNNPLDNYDSNNIPLGKNSCKLNGLTIQKVFHDHIWPIFPQPEKDMSIIDVDYIYAMVGLKIMRSVSSTTPNLTFQEYILISREIYLQDFNNETYEMVINLFSTPALFFYAYNQKAKFQEIDFIPNDKFWIEAYENLFTHINLMMNKIVQDEIENSLHYKLNKKISVIKSRTTIAVEILKQYCDYKHIAKILAVEFYKTFYLWITKLILHKQCKIHYLSNLEKEYKAQFIEIEKIYNKIVSNAIEKVLIDNKLVEIDSNATIISAQVSNYANEYIIIPRKQNDDIFFLFAVENENLNYNFYAFRQVNNVLSLLSSRENEQEFAKAIANDSSIKMEIPRFYQTLKYSNEDHKGFVQRVADIKAKEFVNNLMMYNYDETFGEKVLNFASSLIPFYSCIENANEGKVADATLSCSLDIVSLIPLVGFAAKYSAKLSSSLIIEISKSHLISKTLSGVITKVPITLVLNHISKIAVRTIAREILTKGVLKDLTVASLRTLDPGFELFHQLNRNGFKVLRKLFRKINLKNTPKEFLLIIKLLRKKVKRTMSLLTDQTGLVPLILARHNDYNIVRYFYPGGSNFFGPTCLKSFDNTAELRSIEGYSFPVPVVRESNGIYKQYIPETGKTFDGKLKIHDNDILHRIGFLLEEQLAQVGRNKINYIYYNTVEFGKELVLNSNVQNTVSELVNQNLGVTEHVEDNFEQYANSLLLPEIIDENTANVYPEFHINVRGNVEGTIPHVTNLEFTGTLRGNIVDDNFQVEKFEFPSTSKGIAGDFNLKVPENKKRIGVDLEYRHKKFRHNSDDIRLEIMESNLQNRKIQDGNNFDTREFNEMAKVPKLIFQNQPKDAILEKISNSERRIDTKNSLQHQIDNIPGTSRQFVNVNPIFYENIIKDTYKKYVDILIEFKNIGLFTLSKKREKINFLRNAANKLALLQIEIGLPMQKPTKFWYTQIIRGLFNINYIRKLKGKTFYFSDITLLSNQPLGKQPSNKLKDFPFELEVRYHLTIDFSYGFVDLTNFHSELKNNYLTFNDVLFTVTDTFYTPNGKILNVQMKNNIMTKENWYNLRQQDIKNLQQQEKIIESPRMKIITDAAYFVSQNTIMNKFQKIRDYISNFILTINTATLNIVPNYNEFAQDLIKMKFESPYRNYIIKNYRYINDVLYHQNLDEIIELNEAKRRINDVYNFMNFQNIDETFLNYKKIQNIEQQLRFEDYFVLYSQLNNKLLENKDGIRRFEVAINRLGLRQSGEEFLKQPIKLYRSEMMAKEVSSKFYKSLREKNIIVFDKILKFSPNRNQEELKYLNKVSTSTRIPLLMEITLKNQVGVVDVNRIINSDNSFHVVTSNFQFQIYEIILKENLNGKMMLIKMHDFESTTETRMIRMADRLYELFSTETKFYSDIVENFD
ncbi:uncharacterized protein LOC127277503 [Leptopilina boulardi]|uniref:uncharacterized protein LOC127277503 n=1 Tax=Leptopilina boulardi TaxID=63433 RepID=UPI0021F606E0|nr:uncharacterized protein LOC127277503 [Leptopilina boulardi]